ncbi:MAG: VTT domain-containing protein [Staphylothermus sp.]|nr:VTT domain-containing protein [Staphylothermus sp.]
MAFLNNLKWLIDQYGILGVFIVSLLGNAVPYSTIPYLIFIVVYAGMVKDPALDILIAFSGGLGAAIGKLIVYYFGFGLRKILPEKILENMEVFNKLFKNSAFIAVLLFAALPLPDDIIYVPLGAMKYDTKRYFIALLIGKIIITYMAVYFGKSVTWLLESTTALPEYVTIPILLVITIYLTYLVAKIDWIKLAKIIQKKGILHGIKYLLIQVAKYTAEIFTKPITKLIKKFHKQL